MRCFAPLLAAVALACAPLPARAETGIGQALRGLADTAFAPAGRNVDPPVTIIPTAFAEDGAGFLWAAGQSGIFRWDGYAVRPYLAGGHRMDGLADHLVNMLHGDTRGVLWVGTMSGGLARYDPARDQFVPVPLVAPGLAARGGTAASEGASQIWSASDDGAGGLFVATAGGLYRLDAAGKPRGQWHHDAHDPASLPADGLRAVLRDRQGALWVGGAFGLARAANAQSPGFIQIRLAGPGGAAPQVSLLREDSTGALWIGTHDGAFVLPPGATAPRRLALPGAELAAHEVMAMAETRPGEMWIGTYGQGIVAATADGAMRQITHDADVPKGLDSNVVFGIYRDRAGLAWVSTPFGLSHADVAGGAILPLFDHAGAARGLTVEQPTALLVRRDGSLWVGSEADGIEMIDPTGRQIGRVPVQPIVALAEAPDGRVFAGGRGGAYVIDRTGKSAARLDIPGRGATATVWAMAMLGDTLWLGGDQDGAWALQIPPAGPARVLWHLLPPQLPGAKIASLAALPDGRVAIATGDGLALADPRTGATTVIRPDPADPRKLPSGNLQSLAVDRRGRLWVGTADTGLAILTGTDAAGQPRFARIDIDDGLPNPDIDRMIPDHEGQMWVSTDDGLALIDTQTLAVRPLGRADGAAVDGYWANAGAATADGALLFGGTGGLTIVQPSKLTRWRYAPPVAVTGLRLDGKPAAWNGTEVDLPAGTRSLSVDFAALDYSEPGHNRYRYRLDGFDRDWVETDAAHRVAAYTNLRPGDYTLWLAGSNRNGDWSPSGFRMDVHVRPAWHETLWFHLAEMAGCLAAVGVLVQARTRLLRARQLELEHQVAQRTAELRESQTRLEQLAYFDPLTALPNRRAFNNALRGACDNAAETFALVLVDLDGFKAVNDTLGHDAGDVLLTITAGRLRETVRNTDFVARLGGDEFAIMLCDIRETHIAEQTCERIVSAMAQPARIRDAVVQVGSSVGMALYPQHGQFPDALYKCADLALYDAKRAGRGTWRWYRRIIHPAT